MYNVSQKLNQFWTCLCARTKFCFRYKPFHHFTKVTSSFTPGLLALWQLTAAATPTHQNKNSAAACAQAKRQTKVFTSPSLSHHITRGMPSLSLKHCFSAGLFSTGSPPPAAVSPLRVAVLSRTRGPRLFVFYSSDRQNWLLAFVGCVRATRRSKSIFLIAWMCVSECAFDWLTHFFIQNPLAFWNKLKVKIEESAFSEQNNFLPCLLRVRAPFGVCAEQVCVCKCVGVRRDGQKIKKARNFWWWFLKRIPSSVFI